MHARHGQNELAQVVVPMKHRKPAFHLTEADVPRLVIGLGAPPVCGQPFLDLEEDLERLVIQAEYRQAVEGDPIDKVQETPFESLQDPR